MVFRTRNICPPGVFCITPGILILLIVVCFAGFLFYLKMDQQQQPVNVSVMTPPTQVTSVVQDGRYSMAPRPQRIWDVAPEIPTRGALVPSDGGYILNQRTRGFPDSYQSMGLLKTGDGQLLPLYGRRVASRSDRFNYYTRSDTNNPVPLPVQVGRRDCQDDIGCDELMSGEDVLIPATGQKAQATLYRFDGPTYVPGLL
jgi:Family of unknown function (DUF5755)